MADVYNHEKPDKLEQRAALLNLRSPAPDANISGSRSVIKLCGGDILASLKIGSPRIMECTKYYSYEESQQIMAMLACRKYQMDMDAGRQLARVYVPCILAAQLSKETPWLDLVKEVKENIGVLDAICETVIKDVCDPHLYTDLSAREWARRLRLNHHRLWQGGWQRRYDNVRAVLQELDTIVSNQFTHKT